MNHLGPFENLTPDQAYSLMWHGVAIIVLRDTSAGRTLCTIPNAHPRILKDFRVCGCAQCHIRRTHVYGGLFAWSVSAEARLCARLSVEE